ncbi:DUF5320 domain-containing protein [Patescibacteria group bacterium]
MPNQDGTGPLGRGSMTGRGRGPCGCDKRRGQNFGLQAGNRRSWSRQDDDSIPRDQK